MKNRFLIAAFVVSLGLCVAYPRYISAQTVSSQYSHSGYAPNSLRVNIADNVSQQQPVLTPMEQYQQRLRDYEQQHYQQPQVQQTQQQPVKEQVQQQAATSSEEVPHGRDYYDNLPSWKKDQDQVVSRIGKQLKYLHGHRDCAAAAHSFEELRDCGGTSFDSALCAW